MASTITSSSRQVDEDFINKSLLDQLNDIDPISSSDSEAPPSTSYSSRSNDSPDSSPPLNYHHMAMSSQSHLLHRPASPPDNAQHTLLHHIHAQDPLYPHRPMQNNIFALNGVHNQGNMAAEFSERLVDGQKQKVNGFNNSVQRQTFTAIPNATRPSRHVAQSPSGLSSPNHNIYRDTPPSSSNQSFFPPNDIYTPQLTSPTQSQLQLFDHRPAYDFSGPPSASNGGNQPKTVFSGESYISNNPPSSFAMQSGKPLQGQPPPNQPHMNGFIPRNNFTNALQLSSQTPYGPHVPAGIGANNTNVAGNNGAGSAPNPNGMTQEEISTIFVVGFPDDMQEREFQNMFTFSIGFEAATLKIPNKEYTSYGGLPGAPGPTNVRTGTVPAPGNFVFQGSNDPYNLVTVNQGGVVVDGGRDGTMASWPAPQVDDTAAGNNHFFGNGIANGPPRKQIIGFAKFRTRDEAIIARDMLQGRRVDIEKGAVLKAEMAKKNLHTKRGVGPVVPGGLPTGTNGMGAPNVNGSMGPGQGMQMPSVGPGHPMMQQQQQFVQDVYPNETLNLRDREIATVNAMGLPSNIPPSGRPASHWQHQEPQGVLGTSPRDREEDEERKRDILGAMGFAGSSKLTREEEAEREARKAQQNTALRLRSGSAYDAFHSVPFSRGSQQSLDQDDASHAPGPWDTVRHEPSRRPVGPPSSSGRSSPSAATINPVLFPIQNGIRRSSPPADELAQKINSEPNTRPSSDSCSSSVTGHSLSGASSSSNEIELSNELGGLAVTTENGNTSPQLPSPASGASSGSTRSRIDQNPPINTLYVGNLPTTPPPMGHDVLEGSLRELFGARPGFRRLSFKQKNSGPMCFVEFHDVDAASRTIAELSGNTLNGMVKPPGIRLSYSRNPLGVRTPTSASTPGSVLQQQQQQPPQMFAPTGALPSQQQMSSQNTHNFMMSPPPPRFSSTPNSNYGVTSFTGVPNAFFGNNGGVNFNGYRMSASNESSPPGNIFSPFELGSAGHSNIPEHSPDPGNLEQPHHDFHIPRPLSPTRNIEAARAA